MAACSTYNSTADALGNFSGQAPIDAIRCAYVADYGAGMGEVVFGMFLFGFLGLGLTIRARHPAPIVVAGMLSAGLFATTLPGQVRKIFALVLVFGFMAGGLYLYQRFQSDL